MTEKSPRSDPRAPRHIAPNSLNTRSAETIAASRSVAHDFATLVVTRYTRCCDFVCRMGRARRNLSTARRRRARPICRTSPFIRRHERQPALDSIPAENREMAPTDREHVNLSFSLGQGAGVGSRRRGDGHVSVTSVNARYAMAAACAHDRYRALTSAQRIGAQAAWRGRLSEMGVHARRREEPPARAISSVFHEKFLERHGLCVNVHAMSIRGRSIGGEQPGRGHLPRVLAQSREAEPSEPPESRPPSRPGTETVLVVEDVAALCGTVREWLQQSGYTVLTATRPAEAIAIAEAYEGPIHLLLSDVVMPEMTGSQLAAVICTSGPRHRAVLSWYSEHSLVRQGHQRGSTFMQSLHLNTSGGSPRHAIGPTAEDKDPTTDPLSPLAELDRSPCCTERVFFVSGSGFVVHPTTPNADLAALPSKFPSATY